MLNPHRARTNGEDRNGSEDPKAEVRNRKEGGIASIAAGACIVTCREDLSKYYDQQEYNVKAGKMGRRVHPQNEPLCGQWTM